MLSLKSLRIPALPLWIAACNGHCDIVSYLSRLNGVAVNFTDAEGYTPLAIAAKHGHEEVIRLLLESGEVFPLNSPPDDQALIPVWIAIDEGHIECAKALAPLGWGRGGHTLPNEVGQTRFEKAVAQGNHEIVDILADFECIDLDARNDAGTLATPLWVAAANGHAEVVKILTRYQTVDVNAQDKDGQTPLSIAACRGHIGVVAALIALSKVDPNIEDQDGATPLWHAVRASHGSQYPNQERKGGYESYKP
ncbi:ankyrin repeat domain-containing protein [Aspergillus undulatus]|uniref:ankyrin repeat domain-containing protein n=1 Tax=Aspergillus undulatus TaxID=1810928 RepID=UPI003CCD89F3